MKKYVFFISLTICLLMCFNTLHAQNVAINETDSLPHPSAILDISSEDKGILIPRVKLDSISDTTTISSPEISLLVYNDTVNEYIDKGFYYWSGETWHKLITSNDPWLLEGNSGTSASTNFLGTTDNIDLVFRTNNTEYVRIKSDGDVGIGTTTPQRQLSITKSFTHPHTSSSSIGVIYKDTIRFIHNYKHASATGNNAFFGGNSGNFALTSVSDYNTGLGDSTLTKLTSGSGNTASGYTSLVNNTTGQSNTASGLRTLYNNTTGSNNVAVGSYSLFKNTTRSGLVAIGDSALYNNGQNVTQTYHATGNTAVGDQSLYSNTTGYYNTAVGYKSLESNTTGYDNTAFGYYALQSNTTGSSNTAVGFQALKSNTTGYENTANGMNSLSNNSSGYYNSAFGYGALMYNTTGYENTASGHAAAINTTTGYGNTAFGTGSLGSNTTGTYNTAIGYNAFNTGASYSNSTAIGNGATISASNQIRVGNSSITSIGGQVAWTTLSDGRFKNMVQEDVVGIDFIMQLRPVTYNIKVNELSGFLMEDYELNNEGILVPMSPSPATIGFRNEKSSIRYTGFIGQEVEIAATSVNYNFSGVHTPVDENDLYSISYSEFVVPLVKTAQEQQILIEELYSIIDVLLERIEMLEKE